jgi:hypothetical protein
MSYNCSYPLYTQKHLWKRSAVVVLHLSRLQLRRHLVTVRVANEPRWMLLPCIISLCQRTGSWLDILFSQTIQPIMLNNLYLSECQMLLPTQQNK